MVEQEHSQASSVFPKSINSTTSLENTISNPWLVTDAVTLIKADPSYVAASFDAKPLPTENVIKEEYISSPLGNEEKSNLLLHKESPQDVFTTNESGIRSLYCNDINILNTEKCLPEIIPSDPYFEVNSPLSFWATCPLDFETMKMDDVFQVDKDDLVQSPTLAELNANDESLFDSFDNFDILFPSERKSISTKSSPLSDVHYSNPVFKMSSLNDTDQAKLSVPSSALEKPYDFTSSDTSYGKCSSATELNRSESSQCEVKLQTVPNVAVDVLKTEKNTHMSLDKKPIKKSDSHENISSFNYMDDKSTESTYQLSVPPKQEMFDSEDDSEMDCDYSSGEAEEESDEEPKVHSSKGGGSGNVILEKKKSRFFWQYNMQAKGPKAPKIKLTSKSSILNDFPSVGDPVFSSDCPVKGVKHAGKARRGDGNDLTPNPKKLYSIGLELEKLNSVIDGLIPVNELPLSARSKSRKEKNKLASRACRLKKKAQHEANKLKLFGLHEEQRHLLRLTSEVKRLLRRRIENSGKSKLQSTVAAVETLIMKKPFLKVAGCSTDFVNNVLKNVGSGDDSGGLNIVMNDAN